MSVQFVIRNYKIWPAQDVLNLLNPGNCELLKSRKFFTLNCSVCRVRNLNSLFLKGCNQLDFLHNQG